MLSDDLVSILVCSYNSQKYIIDCLNSIYHQNYTNLELIISDDCSTDNTFEIIKNWVSIHSYRFKNCIIKKNELNLGISKNYNSIIKLANGRFVKIFAADDILLENAICKEVEYLLKYDNYDIVYGNCIIIGSSDKYPIDKIDTRKLLYNQIPKYGKNLVSDLLKNNFIAAPSVMYRLKTFLNYGCFREDLRYEDWEYWLRLSSKGGDIGYINCPIVAYRIYSDSFSHYGKSKKDEERFLNNMKTEEIIVKEYGGYSNNHILDMFYNKVINYCLNYDYDAVLKYYLKNKSFKLSFKNRIKMVLYRLKLFNFFKVVFNKFRIIIMSIF